MMKPMARGRDKKSADTNSFFASGRRAGLNFETVYAPSSAIFPLRYSIPIHTSFNIVINRHG
jgi:hypothetical protein